MKTVIATSRLLLLHHPLILSRLKDQSQTALIRRDRYGPFSKPGLAAFEYGLTRTRSIALRWG